MAEARQLDGVVDQLDADQLAALAAAGSSRHVEEMQRQVVGGVRGVGVRAPRAAESWRAIVKAKLAPKACAVRSRLPKLIGLLTPSMPIPK